MANRIATVKLPLGQQGHSAYIALGDDELRRWETHCRGLEEGEMYPWAVDESRALVTSILGCLFGEDLSQLETPSRAWGPHQQHHGDLHAASGLSPGAREPREHHERA